VTFLLLEVIAIFGRHSQLPVGHFIGSHSSEEDNGRSSKFQTTMVLVNVKHPQREPTAPVPPGGGFYDRPPLPTPPPLPPRAGASSSRNTTTKPWADSFDTYRKTPVDLMEGSRRGSILSYVAAGAMLLLFLLETKAYLTAKYVLSTRISHV
jgi:Endoplasmic Reticulum-Golgi Intermediate Compartment (ERGIC)